MIMFMVGLGMVTYSAVGIRRLFKEAKAEAEAVQPEEECALPPAIAERLKPIEWEEPKP